MRCPSPRTAVIAASLASLAACGVPEHTSRFDPQTPAELQAKATLRGTVSLEAVGTGAPVLADVTISVTGSGAGGATTDADGVWVLGGVSPGTYAVRATRDGYADGHASGVVVTLDDGDQEVEVAPIALEVARGEVTGRIVLEGEAAAAGVVVSIAGVPAASTAAETYAAAASTDAAGLYRLPAVPVGSYVLTATKAGFHAGSLAPVAVAAAVTTDAGQLVLAADAGSIAGTVQVEGAADASGVLVTASGTTLGGTAVQLQQTTLADGAFLLSGAPAGSYVLLFSRPGCEGASTLAVVGPGEAVALKTTTLAISRGTIAGTATLSAGAVSGFQVGTDFSGVVVTLSGAASALSTVTDASGGYRFDGVPVSLAGAAYTLTARKPSFQVRQTTATAVAGTTVTAPALALPVDAGALSGTVLLRDAAGGGGDNATHAGTAVGLTGTAFNGSSWSASTTTAADGTFTLGDLPPGSYDVVAASANRVCGAFGRATVTAGAVTTAATSRCQDALAPTAVALGAPQAPAGGQSGYVAGTSVTVPIATAATDATSPLSNFRGYQVVVGSSADWSAATVVAGQPGALTFGGLGANAASTLWARAVDWIGNAGPVASAQVVSDGIAPSAPTIATPRTFVDATTTSVTLSGSEGDATFAGYEICSYAQAAGSACAASPPGGCVFGPTAAAFAVSLTANQRTCLFARAYDRAGNRSAVASMGTGGVVSDLVAPSPPTLAPAYDPTALVVRAPYVDLFVTAAATDLPAGGAAWLDVAWLEVDIGSGFEPLCPSSACRPGNVWTPCACSCADARLLCDGARFVGIRARLLEGTRNDIAVRAVDLAGNVGSGVSQQVEADSTGDVLAATGAYEASPNVRGRLVTYSEFNPGGGMPHGIIRDLGDDRRLDAADRRCDVSPMVASGYGRPIFPASDTLVVTAEYGSGSRMVRPGADGLFCTGDDAATVFRTPPLNYYTDGVSGFGERVAWWERKNAPGALANLYVREPGGDRVFGNLDDVTTAFAYNYVDALTMGESALLVHESACGDACSTWVWRVINASAAGSWSSGTTTWDLPSSASSAALSADGKRLAWLDAGPVLKVLEPGANGIFDATDVAVSKAVPWTLYAGSELAVDGNHVVALSNTSPISWLVHWWAGPDGTFGTADDTIERIQAAGGLRYDPSLSGSYFAVSRDNDVVGLDLSTLRWEVAPASGLSSSHPLEADGRGWLFYKPLSGDLVARSPAGAETTAAGIDELAALGRELVHADASNGIFVRQPDASGAWFTASAPAPVRVYQAATVRQLAIGGGNALVVDYAYSAARGTDVAHYRIVEPGAGRTLADLTGLVTPVDVLADGVRSSWAMAGAVTQEQVFYSCHDWATANIYLCVHGAGADKVFGTADDPRPATFASAVRLKHPSGSPRAGLDVYDARALKVQGRRMIVGEFSPPAVYLFDAGADGLFNTADDRGRQIASFAAGDPDVSLAGDWAAFLDDGAPAGRQVWLVRGFDGAPTAVTAHYSAKTAPTLEPSGRVFWSDYVFVPEAVFVRAP